PDGGVSFQCQLDGGGVADCTSPRQYTGLATGSHTFQVRAIDAATNVDATPASFTWTVDATPPDTAIGTKPTDPTNSATANFTFSSPDGGVSFQCKLDAGSFVACDTASTQQYTGLADGSHTF